MTLNYTSTEINRTFKIKAYGIVDNKKIDTLVCVSGLINLIGYDLANKFLDRAFSSLHDNTTCKLRRGLKITFYQY